MKFAALSALVLASGAAARTFTVLLHVAADHRSDDRDHPAAAAVVAAVRGAAGPAERGTRRP